ncbi:hypothetical protein ACNYS0_20045 [Streptomyces sp. BH034]|uniref:hypothetical protein n=1 Tax=Streptomyces sp. BH034 TaxID=3402626 RepID=UPI003BB59B29
MNPETTATSPDAARTARVAARLAEVAPTTAVVRTTPVTLDDTPKTLVTLDDRDGRPVDADRAAHRTARDVLRAEFPGADWHGRMHAYDVPTGRLLALAAPTGPAELEAGQ